MAQESSKLPELKEEEIITYYDLESLVKDL